MIFYWLIVLAYVLLAIFSFVWKSPEKTVRHQAWKRIITTNIEPKEVSEIRCTRDEDCPKNYSCLNGGECIPRLMRGGDDECDLKTGRMQKVEIRGVAFAVCVCLFPHLFTQKRFGSNCNVEVACGAHGRYNLKFNKCDCDDGYISEGLNCRPKTAIEQPCQEDEIERQELNMELSHGFLHDNYINFNHADKKCFKRPCTFDALTGRPLQGAHFSRSVQGCVCDPSLGQFGVRLSISEYTTYDSGYNACASIFKEADEKVDVDVYAYFYLRDRDPIVFYAFRNTNASSLNPALRNKSSTFIVGQEFPFDYMQYLLIKLPENVTTRTRRVLVDPMFRLMEKTEEWVYKPYHHLKIECKNIPYFARKGATQRVVAYAMLYAFPACFEGGNVVLNPQQLSYRELPVLFRSNGLKLSYRKGDEKWMLDLSDEPYRIDLYYDE